MTRDGGGPPRQGFGGSVGNLVSERYGVATEYDYWVPDEWDYSNPFEPVLVTPGYQAQGGGNVLYQDATASYDALGRMTSWSEAGTSTLPAASIAYQYDANGNIRRSNATFRTLDANGNASASSATQDYWYRYDALNRVVLQKGELQGGAIVRGALGVALSYDAAGQRMQAVSGFADAAVRYDYVWDEQLQEYVYQAVESTPFVNVRREDYDYDGAGRLIEVKSTQGYYDWNAHQVVAPSAAGPTRAVFDYDMMGRLETQIDYESGTAAFSRALTYNAKSQILTDTTDTRRGATTYRAVSTYEYGSGSSYALGSALTVTTANSEIAGGATVNRPTTLTTNLYEWWDGAVQKEIAFKPDVNQSATNVSSFRYASLGGQRSDFEHVRVNDGRARSISFTNNLLGQTLKRDEVDNSSATVGDPHEIWYNFAGKQMGYVGNNGTRDTDYGTSIQNRTATQGAGAFFNGAPTHTAYADFDQSIAPINSYYQGSSGGAYTVRAGETLASIAAQLWGDASLWYKLAEANGLSGDAALAEGQTLIVPTGVAKNAHNASTFMPLDPSDIAGNTSPTTPKPATQNKNNKCGVFGQIVLVVIAVVVTIYTGNVLAAKDILAAGTIGNAAAAAAVGSTVSQGVGVATGIQEKFSWNAVALSAVSAGVSQGLAGAGVTGVTNAVATNIVTQGVGAATGLQDKFSWAGVAAAAVSMGAGGATRGLGPFVQDAARLIANAGARSLIDGTDFGDNIIAALPDVIAQSLGDRIASDITGRRSLTLNAKPAEELELTKFRPLAEVASLPEMVFGSNGATPNGVRAGQFQVEPIRLRSGVPHFEELGEVPTNEFEPRMTGRSDYRLRFDYGGEGELFAIVAPARHGDGSISYSVGTQGGAFYPFALSEKGASIPELELSIAMELRPEVAIVQGLAEIGRQPIAQAALQVPGYLTSRIVEAILPDQYAAMAQGAAQFGEMWSGHVAGMVSDGRMSAATGADLQVAIPTALALAAAAVGAKGALGEARLGAGMIAARVPRMSVDFPSVRELNTQMNGAVLGVPLPRVHLNTSSAASRFGVYEISVGRGILYKVGKADLLRITQSSGLPTRVHQQVRALEQTFGIGRVRAQVVEDLGTVTTAEARAGEIARLQSIYDRNGFIPRGNRRSFKP